MCRKIYQNVKVFSNSKIIELYKMSHYFTTKKDINASSAAKPFIPTHQSVLQLLSCVPIRRIKTTATTRRPELTSRAVL